MQDLKSSKQKLRKGISFNPIKALQNRLKHQEARCKHLRDALQVQQDQSDKILQGMSVFKRCRFQSLFTGAVQLAELCTYVRSRASPRQAPKISIKKRHLIWNDVLFFQ